MRRAVLFQHPLLFAALHAYAHRPAQVFRHENSFPALGSSLRDLLSLFAEHTKPKTVVKCTRAEGSENFYLKFVQK